MCRNFFLFQSLENKVFHAIHYDIIVAGIKAFHVHTRTICFFPYHITQKTKLSENFIT